MIQLRFKSIEFFPRKRMKSLSSVNTVDKLYCDNYKEGRTLGKGSYSEVKEGFSIKDGNLFAIKIVNKEDLDSADEISLYHEINILKKLKHPNIIRLYEVYHELNYFYLVTELMKGGELFDRIIQKESYTEMEARNVARKLFSAIAYCHSQNIAHRDLKPENLLLVNTENDTEIKIADFGFAKKMKKPNSFRTKCGTPAYVAPEILNEEFYGLEVDNWSLGVIVYIVLSGSAPFKGGKNHVYKKVRTADFDFSGREWCETSESAKNFVSMLLTVNRNKRLTAQAALEHNWMKESNRRLSSNDLTRNLEILKEFNASRKNET